ncbi:Signal peptide protease [Paragonimus heterotremus]|uniref:Signal peptide protease n=1 Tax=Paragonimus heterotremus TaxID=100268 RepID=A0A8J4T2G4_9TREM|nr:Signal peptide protease [Paragonimus heterotremus]
MDALNATDVLNATVNGTLGNVNFGGSMLASFFLLTLAVIPIYVGSILSQRCCDQARMEILTSRDAMHFPLYASFALFGIYILFKFVPKEYINLIVNLHFSALGTFSMATVFAPLFRGCFPRSMKHYLFKVEFSQDEQTETEGGETTMKPISKSSLEFSSKDFVGFAVALAIGIWYLTTRHWIANNFIGVTLSVLAIECIRLNKFTNGCLLLGGLFFYDIFWVFGTPVMVSVAKTLDAPIKGALLSFHRLNRNGSQIYFYTGYAAYIVGLLTTFMVMHVFQAAQPALLYLVPTCLGFPFTLALIRGDLAAMFSYEDVPEKAIEDQQTSDAILDATKKNT